jgi:hypothetical protein
MSDTGENYISSSFMTCPPTMIKSRLISWAGRVECMGEEKRARGVGGGISRKERDFNMQMLIGG